MLLFDADELPDDFFGRPRFRIVPSLFVVIFGFKRIALPTLAEPAGRPRFFFDELSFDLTDDLEGRPRFFFVGSVNVLCTVEF